MIDKVITFGDSFMYGHETNYKDLIDDNFEKQYKKNVGIKFEQFDNHHPRAGACISLTPKQVQKWYLFLHGLDKNQKENCNKYSIGNVLADKLNVEARNYATCGSSNNFIFYNVINKLHEIDNNTLVVCGLTDPSRISRYENIYQPELKHITNMNSFMQSHKNQEKYQLLDLELGNDHTALALQTFAYTRAIVNLVRTKQAKVVFVDPFNTWINDVYHSGKSFEYVKEFLQKEESYRHHYVLDIVDSFNHNIFAPGIPNVFQLLQQKKQNKFCPGGHYSKELYLEYVNTQLLPYLEKNNVLS